VFTDTEITARDIESYSLILFGAADANRVTASFGSQLPLRVTKDAVSIGGHKFDAPAAMVQMLYPNPRNPSRYVWVIAGTSSAGLFGVEVVPEDPPAWDFVISDGHLPGYRQNATRTQTAIASGHFDYNWRYADALVVAGDAAVRAKANHLHAPRADEAPSLEALERYVGKYALPDGGVIDVRREGAKLVASAGRDSFDLLPQGADDFYLPAVGAWVEFQHDASGRITGLTSAGGDDLEAKRQ
jgi:hypothetical protein